MFLIFLQSNICEGKSPFYFVVRIETALKFKPHTYINIKMPQIKKATLSVIWRQQLKTTFDLFSVLLVTSVDLALAYWDFEVQTYIGIIFAAED